MNLKLNKYSLIVLIFGLFLLVGCSTNQNNPYENKFTANASNQNQDITTASENIALQRLNCRELNGFLCTPKDKCATGWLNSSDSYCCSIECNKCSNDVLTGCITKDKCKEAICGVKTDFKCEIQNSTPCANNGICEEDEFIGKLGPSIEEYANGTILIICSTKEDIINADAGNPTKTNDSVINTDCPKNCNDNNINTSDFYNHTIHSCIHIPCDKYMAMRIIMN